MVVSMCPYFRLFGLSLPAYGLFVLLGACLGLFYALCAARRRGLLKEDVLYAFLYGVIGVIAGGKLFYLLLNAGRIAALFPAAFSNPRVLLPYLTGGFVYYGGFLGALLGVYLYARQYRLSFDRLLWCSIPGVPLAHASGRLGCLFAGCCYGVPYEGPFSVRLPYAQGVSPDTSLFPVQPLESGLNLLIFGALAFYARRPSASGRRVLGLYLALYGACRFALEFWRYDFERGQFGSLSTSQWLSLILIPLGARLLFGRAARPPA